MGTTFDFAAYRAAFEAKDVPAWLAFYADHALWLEYRPADPPRAPNVMRGKAEIGAFLERVAALPLTIELSREVLAADRIAFACLVTMDDGRQILEHVIADVAGGLTCATSTSRRGTDGEARASEPDDVITSFALGFRAREDFADGMAELARAELRASS